MCIKFHVVVTRGIVQTMQKKQTFWIVWIAFKWSETLVQMGIVNIWEKCNILMN